MHLFSAQPAVPLANLVLDALGVSTIVDCSEHITAQSDRGFPLFLQDGWISFSEIMSLGIPSFDATDFGFAALACVSLFFLWRLCREVTPGNLAGLILAFSFAFVAKHSAFVLFPVTILLLVARSLRSEPWTLRRPWGLVLDSTARRFAATGALVVILGLSTWVTVWAAYGFRSTPTSEPD